MVITMSTVIGIPQNIRSVLLRLNACGFEAYVVGGCVRDALLGCEPSDWDVCTAATPERVAEIFADFHVIPTGLKHGTVTVVIDGMTVEITTFRIDGDYADGRRPTAVEFARSITEDLRRRDFTINAIAADINECLIDPFGGREDIKRGIIRCVGEADKRFGEDYLRILRALRFAAVLGFDIDADTSRSINAHKTSVAGISAERICSELCKLVVGEKAAEILREYRAVFAEVIPELAAMFDLEQRNPWHIFDVWEHTVASVACAPQDVIIRMTMLLHDIGKPLCFTRGEDGIGHFCGHNAISARLADDILKRLRFDNETRNLIVQLVKYHDYPAAVKRRVVRRILNLVGVEQAHRLLTVKRADALAQNPQMTAERLREIAELEVLLCTVIDERQCFTARDLAVNGRDLMELGVPPGPRLGVVLKKLLDAVIDGKLENEADVLKHAAREMLEQ